MEVDRVVCAVATALRNLAIDQRNKELIGEKFPTTSPYNFDEIKVGSISNSADVLSFPDTTMLTTINFKHLYTSNNLIS